MKMKEFTTFLPLFTGFYGSVWSDTLDFESGVLDEEYGSEQDYDYQRFFRELASNIVAKVMEFTPKELIASVKEANLISPKYYNYTNDRIEVTVTANVKALQDYCRENGGGFSGYIHEVFTDRPGFISHYPNDANDWLDNREGNMPDEGDFNYVGTLWDFYLRNEGYTGDDLYEVDTPELTVIEAN